mmetsp:Transcript_5937/g.13196  ORF Transcript_5937/g.13196 Transcript_5937/m.13196 type:complete len:135 (-) Transcript_5937:137-541(-)
MNESLLAYFTINQPVAGGEVKKSGTGETSEIWLTHFSAQEQYVLPAIINLPVTRYGSLVLIPRVHWKSENPEPILQAKRFDIKRVTVRNLLHFGVPFCLNPLAQPVALIGPPFVGTTTCLVHAMNKVGGGNVME